MARGPRRVFLSHTAELGQYPHNRSFVAAAVDAVNRAGDLVVDVDDSTARADKPAAYIQQQVRACDLYVGLIGTRYGSPVRDRPEVSYAELEFNTATEAGLPRLVFVLDTVADVGMPASALIDREFGARQDAFRDRLRDAGITVGVFASPDQLELVLLQALMELQQQVAPAARGRIFMSYRREESAYSANWLYTLLTEQFGDGQVFMDVDDIEPGANFVDVINAAVGSCEVMLAMIGDRWLAITDVDGGRRIDDPVDFVRLEIEAALARNIRVIPILVSGAKMPRARDLPASIDALAYRQALELTAHRFKLDLGRLIKALENALSASRN
jgi:TIR domain/Domain of unknown function (DUF4062)